MVKKKKNTRNHKTFSEVVGLKAFFQNDIINFIVGILLVLLAIYTIIAYVSFFSTGQNDQSLILDLRPGELQNTAKLFKNSCGSFGAFVSYFFIFAVVAKFHHLCRGVIKHSRVCLCLHTILRCLF